MSKITIVGHKNPDVDSILSGYLLCSYLRYKKYDVEYVITDEKIQDEVLKVLKYCGIEGSLFPQHIYSNSKLILVDHHETSFNNEVAAIIDHHPTIKQIEAPIYINNQASSTTKHIYDIISKECPKYISSRFVELVLIGMCVDTLSFRSSKALPGDKEWFIAMCEKYNLNSKEILRLGDDITDLDDIDKVVLNGCKVYKYNGKEVGTSYINTYKVDSLYIDNIISNLSSKILEEGKYLWVFMIVNLKEDKTTVYEIYKNEILKTEYDFIASRALNVMPEIEKKISLL